MAVSTLGLTRRPNMVLVVLLWTLLLLLPLGMYWHHATGATAGRTCAHVGTCTHPRTAPLTGAQLHNNDVNEAMARLPMAPFSALQKKAKTASPPAPPSAAKETGPAERENHPVATSHGAARGSGKHDPEEQEQWEALLERKCHINWSRAVEVALANWKDTGISEQQLDELCRRKALRVSVRGTELRHMAWNLPGMNLHRVASAVWLLQLTADRAAARGQPLPNVELMLQPGDGSFSTAMPMMQWVDAGPLLSNIKCANDASVSFPFTFHDQFGEGTGRMTFALWEQRSKQLADWGAGSWDAKNNSLFFSAGYGAAVRGNRSHLFETGSPYVKAVPHGFPLSEYGRYRYLAYAYGHCGWSRRLHELAFMDTVVFMEGSTCREYMHYAFDPDTDFVDVREDFADLRVKLEALVAKPDVARAMAARWVTKGREAMSLACTLDYIDTLVRAYARLQRFVPQPRPDWPLYPHGSDQQYFREVGRLKEGSEGCPPRPPDNTHHFERSHVC